MGSGGKLLGTAPVYPLLLIPAWTLLLPTTHAASIPKAAATAHMVTHSLSLRPRNDSSDSHTHTEWGKRTTITTPTQKRDVSLPVVVMESPWAALGQLAEGEISSMKPQFCPLGASLSVTHPWPKGRQAVGRVSSLGPGSLCCLLPADSSLGFQRLSCL